VTFWAQRAEGSQQVDVNVTSGPVSVKVTEHYMHLRHFWGELGKILDAAETEQQASVNA
jgi:hypothetical protein